MSWREGRLVGRAEFEPFGRRLSAIQPLQPDGMDDPIVRAAITRDRSMRQFLGWSILPLAQVERGEAVVKPPARRRAHFAMPGHVVVEDVDRDHRPLPRRSKQGRLIGKAEVAAQPDDGRRAQQPGPGRLVTIWRSSRERRDLPSR